MEIPSGAVQVPVREWRGLSISLWLSRLQGFNIISFQDQVFLKVISFQDQVFSRLFRFRIKTFYFSLSRFRSKVQDSFVSGLRNFSIFYHFFMGLDKRTRVFRVYTRFLRHRDVICAAQRTLFSAFAPGFFNYFFWLNFCNFLIFKRLVFLLKISTEFTCT